MPELLYCFDIRAGEINYSLNISCRKKQIDLSGEDCLCHEKEHVYYWKTKYLSSKKSRWFQTHSFFNKNLVTVVQQYMEEYIQKVILPLIPSNRIVPSDSTLLPFRNDKCHAKVKKSLTNTTNFSFRKTQLTLLRKVLFSNLFSNIKFSLLGRTKRSVNKTGEKQDNSYVIYKVERDFALEQLYIDTLNEIGLNLNATVKECHNLGVEWLNDNYKANETTGIEIKFEKKTATLIRYFWVKEAFS